MKILLIIIFAFFQSANAELDNFLQNRRRSHQTRNPSFEFFPGSMINCTKLQDEHDFQIRFNYESGGYNFYERMYSFKKDCTLETEVFEDIQEQYTCFSVNLERLSEESLIEAENFESDLKEENDDFLRSYTWRINFLIEDNRPNLLQRTLQGLTGTAPSELCPWNFSTHIQIKVTTTGESEYYERIF